jgi:putative Mn2+ efflux pump MntP
MGLAEILLIAVGLALDAFAVSLGVATTGQANRPRPVFRLSFHFGLFQALMPILGWLAGSRVAYLISGVDHWIAMALLAFVGIRMIRSGLDPESKPCQPDPSRGATLIVLCIATSIDAFAVGLSMAMLNVPILYPSAIIGVVTSGLCLVALLIGNRLGSTFGKRMEVVGGLILNVIGLRVLLTHLL